VGLFPEPALDAVVKRKRRLDVKFTCQIKEGKKNSVMKYRAIQNEWYKKKT
jgi:hypothetical protein